MNLYGQWNMPVHFKFQKLQNPQDYVMQEIAREFQSQKERCGSVRT